MRRPPALALLALAALSGCSNSAGPGQIPPGAPDLFDQSVVHSVDVTMSAADWTVLRASFQANTYCPAEVAIDGETVRNMVVRSRRSGTPNGRKPGLKLDLSVCPRRPTPSRACA